MVDCDSCRSDFILANVHAWFGSVLVEQSAGWVWNVSAIFNPSYQSASLTLSHTQFFEQFDEKPASVATNNASIEIGETGWPTGSDFHQVQNASYPSLANVSNLQIFLDSYICQANANGTK